MSSATPLSAATVNIFGEDDNSGTSLALFPSDRREKVVAGYAEAGATSGDRRAGGPLKTLREPVRFLAFEEMEIIHRKALRILAEVGMRIDHDEALDFLQAAGCKVDRQKRQVRFPEDLVEKRVKKMRRDFATREFPERMAVRYSHVRFRNEPFGIHPDFTVSAGGYCVFIYDFDGVRRRATLQDTRDSLKLAAQLDQIAYTGLPVAAQDVPLPVRPVRMAAELVKITDKFGGIETLTPFDIEYTMRIGEVVRGSREELRKRPILVGYAEAKTPLTLDQNMCDDHGRRTSSAACRSRSTRCRTPARQRRSIRPRRSPSAWPRRSPGWCCVMRWTRRRW